VSLAAAALLGVVQGLTEFLPVSSSAHLILTRAFFGWDADAAFGLAFDVACHVGTLTAVVAYFWTDLLAMARSIPETFTAAPGPNGRRIRLIVIGTIPVVLVGAFVWSDDIATATRTPLVAAIALAAGAGLLLAIERIGGQGGGEETLRPGGAFAIGVAQAAALVPGVSRSGATIATGMALGLRREVAARFTFLMSIPAIVAAAAKESLELRHVALGSGDLAVFAVGMVTSGVVGYLAVKYLIRYLATHRLDVFAWYRLALAAATLVWLAVR
jgi:undecaprenyl-diphosphatase